MEFHGKLICETLKPMARAVVQYTFTALLALLSIHGVVPSAQVITPTVIIFRAEAGQQISRGIRPLHRCQRVQPLAPFYVSRIRPEPDTAALFQRPPPKFPLFS